MDKLSSAFVKRPKLTGMNGVRYITSYLLKVSAPISTKTYPALLQRLLAPLQLDVHYENDVGYPVASKHIYKCFPMRASTTVF